LSAEAACLERGQRRRTRQVLGNMQSSEQGWDTLGYLLASTAGPENLV
jgi:hypothetical protein